MSMEEVTIALTFANTFSAYSKLSLRCQNEQNFKLMSFKQL